MKHTVEVMISEKEVTQRVKELGQQISEHYKESEGLVMIGLLRGSFVFMADLARAIDTPMTVDFMTASSYGNSMESTRDVRILKDLDDDIKGKDILLVEDIIDTIKHARVAGLVLTPPFSEQPEFVKRITALDIKVVRIMSGDVAPDELSPCVMVNDRDAAQTITQHLVDLGHKKIAFIAGGAEHMSTIERYKGYRRALKANNIEYNKDWVIEGEYSFESGVNGAKQLMSTTLKPEQHPSAIFSCNDEIAAGALFAARLMNINIPEQLSITGFENSPFSRQTWPKLTTANQPNKQIAHDASSLLISQIRKQKVEKTTSQYIPQLVVRDSTGEHV